MCLLSVEAISDNIVFDVFASARSGMGFFALFFARYRG
jgi:hypothetical protein